MSVVASTGVQGVLGHVLKRAMVTWSAHLQNGFKLEHKVGTAEFGSARAFEVIKTIESITHLITRIEVYVHKDHS